MTQIELMASQHSRSIRELMCDPKLSRTSSVSASKVDTYISGAITENSCPATGGAIFVIIVGTECVGSVSIKNVDRSIGSGELSYWIGARFQRRGYAFEGALLATRYAFDVMMLEALEAHYLREGNKASGVILRKLGFVSDPNQQEVPAEGRFAQYFPGDVWTFLRLDRTKWLQANIYPKAI